MRYMIERVMLQSVVLWNDIFTYISAHPPKYLLFNGPIHQLFIRYIVVRCCNIQMQYSTQMDNLLERWWKCSKNIVKSWVTFKSVLDSRKELLILNIEINKLKSQS